MSVLVVTLWAVLSSSCLISDLVLSIESVEKTYRAVSGRDIFHDGEITFNCDGEDFSKPTVIDDSTCSFSSIYWMRHRSTRVHCTNGVWHWTREYQIPVDSGILELLFCNLSDIDFKLETSKNVVINLTGSEAAADYGVLPTGWNVNMTPAEYLPSGMSLEFTSDTFERTLVRCLTRTWTYYHSCGDFCSVGSSMSVWWLTPIILEKTSPCLFANVSVDVLLPEGKIRTYTGADMRQFPLLLQVTGAQPERCDYMNPTGWLDTYTSCYFSLEGYTSEKLECPVRGKWHFRTYNQSLKYPLLYPQGGSVLNLQLCSSAGIQITIISGSESQSFTGLTSSVIPVDCDSHLSSCLLGNIKLTCNGSQWKPAEHFTFYYTTVRIDWNSLPRIDEASQLLSDKMYSLAAIKHVIDCEDCLISKYTIFETYTSTSYHSNDELIAGVESIFRKEFPSDFRAVRIFNSIGDADAPVTTTKVTLDVVRLPVYESSNKADYSVIVETISVVMVFVVLSA